LKKSGGLEAELPAARGQWGFGGETPDAWRLNSFFSKNTHIFDLVCFKFFVIK